MLTTKCVPFASLVSNAASSHLRESAFICGFPCPVPTHAHVLSICGSLSGSFASHASPLPHGTGAA